jgi:signal transduction histidine kinase
MYSSTTVAADGTIFASTFNNGISTFKLSNQKLTLLDTINQLPSNMVYRIHADEQGKIWASSNNGLLEIENNILLEKYSKANGQPISEFNQNAMAVGPNGDLYFGGLYGVLAFNPKNITYIHEPPLVWIESIEVNYVGIFNNLAIEKLPKSIKLDKDSRTFTATIALQNLDENAYEYYYKLKNFDQAKRKYLKSEVIQYTNLPYQSFELEFWAENENEKFMLFKLPIKRVPPLWMQLWFQLLMAIGLALFISGSVWRYRLRQLKQQLQLAEVANKVQGERLRISRELHDNIGSQLTYVISTLDNLNYQKDEVQKSKKLTDLGSFTRNVMGQLRETIWAMGETNTSVSNLKNRLLAIVSRQQEISKAKIVVDIDAPSDFVLEPTQALNLLRCIQEALNNAIKYAHAKKIKIEAKTEKGQLTFIIHDDGRGFEPTSAQNGNGMQNMKTRMAEINGTFQIESKPGVGTKITLRINP